MKISNLTLGLGIAALSLGCVVNDDDATGGGTDSNTGGETDNTTPGTVSNMTNMTNGQTGDTTAGTDPDTTAGTDPQTDSGTTAVDPGPFVDSDPDPTLYTRVDRMGMPAVNTALISCDDPAGGDCTKDDYNNADRSDDVTDTFLSEISASIGFLINGVRNQLENDPMGDPEGFGLTSCGSQTTCRDQADDYILPDTLRLDLSTDTGFPNGRGLADQAIDITLAVLLLDITATGQSATTFAEFPVNPPANDVEFGTDFPFLAPAH